VKTADMEVRLARWFDYRLNLIVPNVHWGQYKHECDLLIVSKAGYVTECEIKTSRADLRNDRKKWHGHNGGQQIKFLYFAVPPELEQAAIEFAPERAGILLVYSKDQMQNPWLRVRRARDAIPNKEATKVTAGERYNAARLGALRIWGLKERNADLNTAIWEHQAQIEELKQDDQSKLAGLLLALLDRIELENDASLAGQRHDIAEQCGLTVEFGEPASGSLQ